MNGTRSITLVPAVVAGLLVVAFPGMARSAEDGGALYKTYCASCHGATGRGTGSIAVFLRVPPADLTQIAKRIQEKPAN